MPGVHYGTIPLVPHYIGQIPSLRRWSSFLFASVSSVYVVYVSLLINYAHFCSRYTLAGVNAVKEMQVTRDMTDCIKKNGPLQKQII